MSKYHEYVSKITPHIFYFIPVTLLLWFVYSFSVNVPFLDHWGLVNLFERIASGNATFRDFFVQHFEHRMLFPRIIFALLAFSSNWNVVLEQWVSIILAIVAFYALYKISAKHQNGDRFVFHLVNIASCILFFSIMQFTNWLWGFQLAWYLINTCVILGIYFLTVADNLASKYRIALAVLCCFVASFSSAHGLPSWLALIPSVAFVASDVKQRRRNLLLWLTLFLLCGIIYAIGYQSSVGYSDKLFFLKNPLVAGAFLLMIVGSSLGQVINPAITGLLIIINFLGLTGYYLKKLRSEFARDAAPWLSLGLFATIFVLITTIGRAEGGIGYSLQPRYTTSSILLVISSIQMWRLVILHKNESLIRSIKVVSLFSGAFGFLIAIFIANSTAVIAEGRQLWLQLTSGKTCIEVINYLDKSIDEIPDSCLSSIINEAFKPILRESVDSLNTLGFRSSPQEIAFITKSPNNHGTIEEPSANKKVLTLPKSSSVKLSGWATLPDSPQQPRVVLLSYNEEKTFFANAVVRLPRADIGRMLKRDRYSKIGWDRFGWEVSIPGGLLPLGENTLKAWVYDQENQQFVQLQGNPKINVIKD
ncbi:hypothetical protein NIES2119_02040 [[Phormidium ambiguum] IAM M-71]|uniref:Glycosyltransferase RgtA/B/C/D-like domain-containing protein n=1 Tax=[Phormidium ambiguum] IAM M-71 TaxID=454136 RepID=A0A1U7ISK3_9CYAN|nr:hypothetical protein [Phormidium ambiguum]OKH40426.1 hypothetical protein NIES2119_02040 [Phormidium ambiguum IAM M-71]